MNARRRLVVSAWLGFALAGLFFYPLAVALGDDRYYLQWQQSDAVEFAVAWVLLAGLLGLGVFHAWDRGTRAAAAALVAVGAVPLLSFAAGVSRQLPFDDLLRRLSEVRSVGLGGPVAVLLLVGVAFVFSPAGFSRWFQRALIGVSPVSLVVLAALATSVFRPSVVTRVEAAPAASAAMTDGTGCGSVLALLFDELSFSYLYDADTNVRQEFPAIRALAASSVNYLSVEAPAGETLVSLPSFLAARHVRDIRVENGLLLEFTADGGLVPFSATEPDGLFATARRLGFATEMAGYYLPYCELLRGVVDACQSLSFYNVSTAHDTFSPANPVLTTLVLWPRQFPFGVFKNLAFGPYQRALVDDASAFMRRAMPTGRPLFRFVHFSVPHFPFVFSRDGYDPPFNPLQTSPDTAYVRQLQFVDRIVGEVVASMRASGTYESSTIVLLSDHGFRFQGREQRLLQIPVIAKMPGQQVRADEQAPVRGETLLKSVLEQSCPAGGPRQPA